jgi:DIM protein
MKRLSFVATCVLAIMAVTASSALAGEVTGNGKPTQGPAHANSICVFSGQNDDPNAPIISAQPIPGVAPNGPGGRTQSYGQDVRYGLLNHTIVTPGMTCRGGSNPDR